MADFLRRKRIEINTKYIISKYEYIKIMKNLSTFPFSSESDAEWFML